MLEESPLPGDMKELERKHSIRTANEKKALRNVLNDFFKFENSMFLHSRCDEDIISYRDKSLKASKSAKKRWEKDANAVRTHSEGNANHKPLTINHKPITNNQDKKSRGFSPPSLSDVKNYCLSRNNLVDVNTFFDFYASKGWMVGKNKMKDWKACVRVWEKRDGANNGQYQQSPAKRGQSLSKSERRDEAARRYLEENNDDGVAWPTGHEVSP
jgi:uncharacterized protein YdaU (DUF1376 family)